MSDNFRKDFSDKAAEAIKPDSQKGVFEKAGESVTNAADSLAGSAQPNSDKGFFQRGADHAGNAKDSASKEGESFIDSAKNLVNSASDYLTGNSAQKPSTK
ncbi:hypothetical protein D0Z00_000333 [Geotrichum galactomycetum]|uniref:Uncharacterized protein n=1 Tax=Geotrichum galactomycetum TaxID=27317 RepID=A0ACB6VAE5_9ASCO|nr:hypothetical protein D0Z00_000333 [Geotrichum candidum]